MLGGAVGLNPAGSHKHFSSSNNGGPNSPLDLESWRETFLQQQNNNKNVS